MSDTFAHVAETTAAPHGPEQSIPAGAAGSAG